MLGIAAIAHAYGRRRIDNVADAAEHGFEPAFVRDRLGILTRYAAGEDQATSDLAAEAGKAVLDASGVRPDEIDAVVVVTQTPDYQLPHTAALVQRALNLPRAVASFDMSLGCSGYVYGLSTLVPLMEHAGLRHGLLITADCYSKVSDKTDRNTAPLFSDAAAATLIAAEPAYRLGKPLFGTEGGGAEALIVKCGGSRAPAERSTLYMDGRAIFNFAMSRIPEHVERCAAQNGLRVGDIDRFVFHQANRYMLESLRDRMKLPPEKVVVDVEDGGNSVGSTIPIALERLLGERHRHILICGFGVGLSWATNVLELQCSS